MADDELTESDMEKIFRKLDKDGSGQLSVAEFTKAARCLGLNPSMTNVEEAIKPFDKDENGTLDMDEFKSLVMQLERPSIEDQKQQLLDAFTEFDADGSGFVDMAEFKAAMREHGESMSDEEIEEMFQEVPPNDQGGIKFQDFIDLFCTNPRLCLDEEEEEA